MAMGRMSAAKSRFILGSLGDFFDGGLCERKGHRMGQRLLLGRRRVIAATGAGRIAGFAGGVFEVGGHGASPVNFLSVIRFSLRSIWNGIECDLPSMDVSIQNGTGKDTERSRTHRFLERLGRKIGVFAIFPSGFSSSNG